MIRLAVALGLAFAFFTGCAEVQPIGRDVGVLPALDDAPGLAGAAADIWQGYGQTDHPPRVVLMTGADLSCVDPNSGNPGFQVIMASGPDCREGWTVLPSVVNVAFRGQPWSQSALAHEYEHAKLLQRLQGTPIGDPAHLSAGFQLGGEVDRANARLASEGQ